MGAVRHDIWGEKAKWVVPKKNTKNSHSQEIVPNSEIEPKNPTQCEY